MDLQVVTHIDEKVEDRESFFLKIFEKTMAKISSLKKIEGVIELNIVDENSMREINLLHRKKDYATDVLSFPYLDSVDIIKGEIFICMRVAEKQALEKKHNLERELEILFVHGLLHVAGYDHNNDEEEKEMEEMAKAIHG